MFALPNPGAVSGAVKSVQRGAAASSPGPGTDVTINPVDVNKSIVLLTTTAQGSTDRSFIVTLKNTTTVNLTGPNVISLGWQVVEYY